MVCGGRDVRSGREGRGPENQKNKKKDKNLMRGVSCTALSARDPGGHTNVKFLSGFPSVPVPVL